MPRPLSGYSWPCLGDTVTLSRQPSSLLAPMVANDVFISVAHACWRTTAVEVFQPPSITCFERGALEGFLIFKQFTRLKNPLSPSEFSSLSIDNPSGFSFSFFYLPYCSISSSILEPVYPPPLLMVLLHLYGHQLSFHLILWLNTSNEFRCSAEGSNHNHSQHVPLVYVKPLGMTLEQ